MPPIAALLGIACLACGLAVAHILGQLNLWRQVLILGALIAVVQFALAVSGLSPIAAFGGGVAGIVGGILLGGENHSTRRITFDQIKSFFKALMSYVVLTVLMAGIAIIPPVRAAFAEVVWRLVFPETITTSGFTTAINHQAFRPLLHPGILMMVVSLFSYFYYRKIGSLDGKKFKQAARATFFSAAPATLGVTAMVGLATIMDYCGMTMLLAQGLSLLMGVFYPLTTPLVGILGAFATGSNNNSNVLFILMQQNAAMLLGISAPLMIAAQTVGGSLGSMLAPAKVMVGCSTVGLRGREGAVLQRTLVYGLTIGVGIGILTFILASSRLPI